MKFPTGGELLVDCLVRQGVSHAFSIIGGQMGTIYEAIGNSPDIEVVVPRCETAAALMACGYTASSGAPCVSMATVGAGVVYEVAGLSKAWFDYIPVVSIAPQVQSYRVKPHQESLQACNQDELFFPVTKWNTIVFQWGRIPQMVDRAFREANSGIPGPVHVDIPVDVLFGRGLLNARRERRMLVAPGRTRYEGPVRGSAGDIASAAAALGESSKPIAIVGQGFGRNGRYRETTRVLAELGIPVVTTAATPGFSQGDGCYAGDVRALGDSQVGLELLAAADLLLLVGADRHALDALAVFDAGTFKAVVQVEVDPRAFLTGRVSHSPVYADPLSALTAIKERLAGYAGKIAGWNDELVSAGKQAAVDACGAHPTAGEVFKLLAGVSDENFILVADGPESKIAAACLLTGASYRDLFIMDETDVPGAGLPFALGAAIANPEDRVVLITDKDPLFYHVRELQPAACGPIPITLICIDDASAANVADTESVLAGLGCEVREFDPGRAREDLLAPRPLAPIAFIAQPV